MPSPVRKLRTRLCSRDTECWNHRRRMLALLPLWSVLGYTIGYFGGVHWVPPTVPDPVVSASFAALAIVIGTALLALVD